MHTEKWEVLHAGILPEMGASLTHLKNSKEAEVEKVRGRWIRDDVRKPRRMARTALTRGFSSYSERNLKSLQCLEECLISLVMFFGVIYFKGPGGNGGVWRITGKLQ